MFANLVPISNLTPLRKLLCETRRSKFDSLKILLMRAMPSAFLLLGTKKKKRPTATSKVSTLFQRSMKKFSGPKATTLRRSSTKKTQMKMLSKV